MKSLLMVSETRDLRIQFGIFDQTMIIFFFLYASLVIFQIKIELMNLLIEEKPVNILYAFRLCY